MSWPLRILSLLAIAGAAGAGVVAWQQAASPQAAAVRFPATDDGHIAASGIVEASTGTIAVGPPATGLVQRMDVTWNQWVPKGVPLFGMDDRDLSARRGTLIAAIAQAQAVLPAVRRKLDAVAAPQMRQFVTQNDLVQRQSDMAVATANVAAARAQLRELDAQIARLVVRAPISGRILKINVRPGEIAEAAGVAPPVLLMGADDRLYVRIDVDEHDAWRVKPGVAAEAFIPGDRRLHAPLTFVRIEPFLQPKTSLTGAAAERTDTRVLQLIYSFDPKALPAYIGQQLDIVLSPASAGRKPM